MEAGSYSLADLVARGFVGIQSIMVPFGYKLVVTRETPEVILENVYFLTATNISANNVSSVQVVKI